MTRWSSSGTAVEVTVPTSDPGVASMREDPPILLQYAGVGLKPTLDIVSDGRKKAAGLHLLVYMYMYLEIKFALALPCKEQCMFRKSFSVNLLNLHYNVFCLYPGRKDHKLVLWEIRQQKLVYLFFLDITQNPLQLIYIT